MGERYRKMKKRERREGEKKESNKAHQSVMVQTQDCKSCWKIYRNPDLGGLPFVL